MTQAAVLAANQWESSTRLAGPAANAQHHPWMHTAHSARQCAAALQLLCRHAMLLLTSTKPSVEAEQFKQDQQSHHRTTLNQHDRRLAAQPNITSS
jgi:hypothetical protein